MYRPSLLRPLHLSFTSPDDWWLALHPANPVNNEISNIIITAVLKKRVCFINFVKIVFIFFSSRIYSFNKQPYNTHYIINRHFRSINDF